MPFFFRSPVSIVSSEGEAHFNYPDGFGVGDIGGFDVVAYMDKLDGWTNTVKPTVFSAPKAVGDGSRMSRKFYHPGRVLMAGGVVATESAEDTETAWNNMVKYAFPMNETVRLTHYGPQPKYSDVRVISDVRCTQLMPLGFRFEVDLMSEDSYLYDAADTLTGVAGTVGSASGGMTFPLTFPLDFNTSNTSLGGSVSITNIGNAPSRPYIEVSGPLDSGWRIENTTTGKHISFAVGIASGQTLEIDFKTRTAIVADTSVAGLVEGDWWEVVPGTNVIKLYGNYSLVSGIYVVAKSAWR